MQEVIGDHVAEFNRILDYRDVLLQINHGSAYVVKLTDLEDVKKQFHSLYIFFDSMSKGFRHGCKKYIGLDDYVLKGIVKVNS